MRCFTQPGILSAIGYKTEYVPDAASNNIKPAGCKVAVVLECSICQCILSDCVPSCNVEETFQGAKNRLHVL